MEITQPETLAVRKIIAIIVILSPMVRLNQCIPTLVMSIIYLSLLGNDPWELIFRSPRGWTKEGIMSIAVGLLLMAINNSMWTALLFVIIAISAFGHNIENTLFPFLSQDRHLIPGHTGHIKKEKVIDLALHSWIKDQKGDTCPRTRSEEQTGDGKVYGDEKETVSEGGGKEPNPANVWSKTSNDKFAAREEERNSYTFSIDGDTGSTAKHSSDEASNSTWTWDVPLTHGLYSLSAPEHSNRGRLVQSSPPWIETKGISIRLNGRNQRSTSDSENSSREGPKNSLPQKPWDVCGTSVCEQERPVNLFNEIHTGEADTAERDVETNLTNGSQREEDEEESSFQSARDIRASAVTSATSDTSSTSFETASADSADKAAWSRARAVAQTRAANANPVKIVYIAQGACQAGVDADWIPKPFRDEVATLKGADILRPESSKALYAAFTIKKIGKGGNGHVYSFRLPQWPEPKVVKYLDTVRKPDMPPGQHIRLVMKSGEYFEDEFAALSAMDHPNLVKVFAFNRHWDEITSSITMEQMDGDLDSLLRKTTGAEEKERVLLEAMRSALSALEHMHSRGYVHRDIKSANILYQDVVDSNGVLCRTFKVADLGWVSQRFGAGVSWQGSTEGIYPPEVKESGTLDRRFDVWSCFMMLAHELDIGNFKSNRVRNEETILRMQTIAQDDPRSWDFEDWFAFQPEKRATAEIARERVDLMLALPCVQATAGTGEQSMSTRLPVTTHERESRNKCWADYILEKARSQPEKFFEHTGDLWTYDRLWNSHAVIMKQLFPPGGRAVEEMGKVRSENQGNLTPQFESCNEGVETWHEKLRSTVISRLRIW